MNLLPNPRVFISYSHDSDEHMNRVLRLADRLRSDGVDCSIDQYEVSPPRGWAGWSQNQIEEADFVLVVCTETYIRRVKGKEKQGLGLGAKWEGAVITQGLYDAEANNRKFIPVLFSPDDVGHIPTTLKGATHYDASTEIGYEALYRHLTNQPLVIKPDLGTLRPMPPRERKQVFLTPATSGQVEHISHDLDRPLAIQRRIIEEHTRRFVGRSYVQQAFERFMVQHSSGYFILRGVPGQGKTAISSSIAKTYDAIYHFISRTAGRSDIRLILRSLVAQTFPRLKIDHSIPESISDLATRLQQLSTLVVEQEKRLIVVIDALDELREEDRADLPFLFADPLPEGTYVLATSRPGEIVSTLEEQLFSSPYQIFDLGPLELTEMREILTSDRVTLSEGETERIAEASQGNALYLRAVMEELNRSPTFDVKELPKSIEGFFRRAIKSILDSNNQILHDLLGLLAVARKPLTISELSQILGKRQREINEQGVRLVSQFLLEVDDAYRFYHVGFHDFVTQELFYEDELGEYHRMLANWLQRPESHSYGYRWSSLAYHLFASGQKSDLGNIIDAAFLTQKVRRQGYAVLEDLELLTQSMLEAGDPAVIERCVELVDRLREVAGGDIIHDASRTLQLYRPGPFAFRAQVITPHVEPIPGLDVYAGMLPKVDVAADFFEIVPLDQRLIIALGDVPATGIKSSFVARFIGNVFRKLMADTNRPEVGKILSELNSIISGHEYFKWVSMQCVELDVERGILTIASAGHPSPVLYSSRRRKCDLLPIRGEVLHSALEEKRSPTRYEERHAEIAPGDILIMLTDGLTEAHLLRGQPYGYRFTEIVERLAEQSAKTIGQAILDDWRAHPRDADFADDVTVIAIKVKQRDRERD